MANAAGQLTYRLGLDSAGFEAALKKAVGLVLSYKVVMAGIRQIGEVFRLGGELKDLSDQTGESAGNLLILQKAFEGAGIGAGMIASYSASLRTSLSGINEMGEKTSNSFAALGLNMADLKGLSVIQQFEAIGNAIAKLKTQEDKVAAARAIFGRGGAPMLGLFANPGSIDAVRQALGSMPQLMDKNAAAMDRVGDSWKLVKTSITGAFAGALAPALPLLDSIAAKLTAIDFTKIGINLAAGFQALGNVLRSIDIGQFAAALFDVVLISLGGAIQQAFSLLWNPSFWKGIGLLLIGALEGLGIALINIFTSVTAFFDAGIQQVIDKIFALLAKIPGLEDNFGGRENKSFSQHYDESKAAQNSILKTRGIGAAGNTMKDGLDLIGGALSNAGKSIAADISASAGGKYFSSIGQDFKSAFTDAQASMMAGMAAQVPAAGSPGGVDTAGKFAGRGSDIPADRWAKIGAFAGGSASGLGLDYARSTARNTSLLERTATRIQNLIQNFQPVTL